MTPAEEQLYLTELHDKAFKLFIKTQDPTKPAGPQIAASLRDLIDQRIEELSAMTEVYVVCACHGETESIAGVYRNKKAAEAKVSEPGLIESCYDTYIVTCKLQ